METLKTALQTKQAKIAAAGGLMAVSGVASADTATAIGAAFTGANTNLGLVVAGVIALAAIATGVGLIIKFLSH
jgi:hypothetical protein